MRKSCAQSPNGCAISTRQYGSLTLMAIKAPEFSNATFCSASHRTSAHQYDQFSSGTTARGMSRLWLPARRLREGQGEKKTTPFLQRMNEGFSISNTATTFPTKQDRIYNSNFQNAEPDIDLSVGVRCLSDLGWISGACVNSRYTGADCNISSLPGRLASINRPIHQAAVLPLTHVSEASEGNKWWREGINQTEGGQTPGPWLVQSSPEMEHDGGAGLRCTMETPLLFSWDARPGLSQSGLQVCSGLFRSQVGSGEGEASSVDQQRRRTGYCVCVCLWGTSSWNRDISHH